MPGPSASRYVPSAPERVLPARCPAASTASISAATGRGGHGLLIRSTGHVGPADTVPMTPVPPAGGLGDPTEGLADGVPEGEAGGVDRGVGLVDDRFEGSTAGVPADAVPVPTLVVVTTVGDTGTVADGDSAAVWVVRPQPRNTAAASNKTQSAR